VEGMHMMGPIERERCLAKQRVDRSHRSRNGSRRHCRHAFAWTQGEKAALTVSLSILFGEAALSSVMFLP
jgi:hypothetical protein